MFVSATVSAGDTLEVETRPWYVPDFANLQFAGNIGFLSAGVGYHFFDQRLNTALMYGFVPQSLTNAKPTHTITIKNTAPIFNKKLGDYTISPTGGLGLSFDTGNNSQLFLPKKYPDRYYFTNAFHLTFIMGAKMHKEFKGSLNIKGADFYVELVTVETYIYHALKSSEIPLSKAFSMALGINLYF